MPAKKTKESIAKPSLLMAQLFWSTGVLASAVSLRKLSTMSIICTSQWSRAFRILQNTILRIPQLRGHSRPRSKTHLDFFNPWRIGDRPRILNRVKDVQPNLVQRLVAMFVCDLSNKSLLLCQSHATTDGRGCDFEYSNLGSKGET